MTSRSDNVLRLQDRSGGVATNLRSVLKGGRFEIVTNGPNPEFNFIGSDPYNTNAYTGLVVPATPSSAIANARYLFLLTRASFSTGEQSASNEGVRLVGIRQYAELIARIPAGTSPLVDPSAPVPFTISAGGVTVSVTGNVTANFAVGDTIDLTPTTPIAGPTVPRTIVTSPVFSSGSTTWNLNTPIDDSTTAGNITGGPSEGSTVTFRKEIISPLWHPPDGDISWAVTVIPKTQRDTRNPANTDGFIYQDALSPALLYQTTGPYTPPNGGRPWGTPIGASLGNIHELRYPWRTERSEVSLDIPIPVPCDVALFASVRQNNPELNPAFAECCVNAQFAALSPEDQFLVAYSKYAQYGSIAGALVFDQNLGEDVP